MARRSFCVGIGIVLLIIAGIQPGLAQSDPDDLEFPPELPLEPHIPGTVEGTGKYFEVTNSEYLDITLESTEPVKLRLESIPHMVVMDIEAAEGATSTQLTLGGFPFSTTFYKYEDDYHNGAAMTTDASGSYAYIQDLSLPHHVFIQPNPSTRFIPSDTQIGIWDGVNRVYTLTSDVDELIQIDDSELTLEGAWHRIKGVYVAQKHDVTVKSLVVEGGEVGYGICLHMCSRCTIEGNTLKSNRGDGIILRGSPMSSVVGNMANWNGRDGIRLDYGMAGHTSHHCMLTGNTANSNQCNGIMLNRGGDNTLRNNSMSGNRCNFCLIAEAGDWDHSQDIDTSNLVDGRPIYYLTGVNNQVFDSSTDAGVFYLIKCDGITIKDLTLANNSSGVRLYNTHNSRIENVTVSDCLGAIELLSSANNAVLGSHTSNCDYGIYMLACNSTTLQANTALSNEIAGFYISGCSSTLLTDNTASGNGKRGIPTDSGIYIGGCTATNLTGNSAIANHNSGIYLNQCYDTTLTGNTASSNGAGTGIWLANSSLSTLQDNIADSNLLRGMCADCSSGTTMSRNSMTGNARNFTLSGCEDSQTIDTTNTVDGKPIYYLNNVTNSVYDASCNAGTIYCINCQGISIRDLTLSNNHAGVYLWQSQDMTVQNVTADSNFFGVTLRRTHDSTIEHVTAHNSAYGLQLDSSCGNTLFANSAHSGGVGIYLMESSDNNTLSSNLCCDNYYGIRIASCADNILTGNTLCHNTCGADIVREGYSPYDPPPTDGHVLTRNTASFNILYGISVASYSCGNTLSGNITDSNQVGINVESHRNALTGNTTGRNQQYGIRVVGSNNLIYSNNFIENPTQAVVSVFATGNVFNLDPPAGGNYWSDWTSPDVDGDGFVDSPYIFEGGEDDYPLADKDSDGISDNVENGAPNGGDGNKDGILDSEQENVASLPNAPDGRYVTFESPDGTQLVDVVATGNPSPDDAPTGVAFPVGFFEFRVQGVTPGGSTTVTLYLPQKVDTFYKYGPEPGNLTHHWFEFLYDGTTGAKILGNKVLLYFVDGERGDYDLQANGEIVEPGAVAIFPRSWLGFLPPLSPDNKRLFKQGSTIPVKFRISDPDGMPVSDAYATLSVYYFDAGAPPGEPEVESTAAGDWGNQFRYDPDDDLYIFNLSTKDPSFFDWFTYELVVTLDDSQTHVVDFSLK